MKLIITAITSVVLIACNENHSSHEKNNSHSSHADMNSMTTENEIRASMDSMMQLMHRNESTGNIDVDFSTMMVAHHFGAVNMSQILLSKGADTALKNFAQKVIDDQNKEITLMQNIISGSEKTLSPNAAMIQNELHASMNAMHGNIKIHNDINKDFAEQMIPHHQSAVDMARVYLKHGKNEALVNLSNQIIISQEKEITWLKAWLDKNSGS